MITVYFGKFGKHKDNPRRWGNFWEDIDGNWNFSTDEIFFVNRKHFSVFQLLRVMNQLWYCVGSKQTHTMQFRKKNDPWTLLLQWIACTMQQLEIKSNWQGLFIFGKCRCVKIGGPPQSKWYIPYIYIRIYIYIAIYNKNVTDLWLLPFDQFFFFALLQVMMPSAKTGIRLAALGCWVDLRSPNHRFQARFFHAPFRSLFIGAEEWSVFENLCDRKKN